MPNIFKVLIGLILLSACSPGPETIVISGDAFGTTYNVSIVETAEQSVDEAALKAAIEKTIAELNSEFSNWDPNSTVSKFNDHPSTDAFPVPADFLTFMDIAQQVHQDSNGYLDMTLAPLIDLWGFFKPGLDREPPSQADIDAALTLVGQDTLIKLDRDVPALIKAQPDVTLNLSAIAKGYGIDRLANDIEDHGFENFMVEVGGDLFARGMNAQGRYWSLGLEKPVAGQRSLQQIVRLANQGMATSGDYRNYYEEDGVRYSHIIEPVSGRPVTHRTASVTVFADNATLADGWATALLAMGTEDGLGLADERGLAVIFIDRAEGEQPGVFEVTESRAYIEAQSSAN